MPTRFFQSLDAYPPEWGRLLWRVQLNALHESGATLPAFRTFYTGVEWNLRRPGGAWFLTAWFMWDGPGPRYRSADVGAPVSIEGDTALFRVTWMPKERRSSGSMPEPDLARPVFLRSRVDARERRRISESVRAERSAEAASGPGVILLDDVVEGSR